MKLTTKELVLVSVCIALTVIGSMIKIPSPFGTVALDSAPAFLAAFLFGPVFGAIVAFFGHMLTALNVGMPLTVLIHLLIATQMAIVCSIAGLIYKKGYFVLALISGFLLNGVVAPATFIIIPQFGMPFFTAMIVPLLLGVGINLAVAAIIVRTLRGRVRL
ncbi:ECF transporter S component [Anaerobacillus alkaliphilus]|uniref:ECF transporter S component n=1 Tax=Anaerobacillus alkaliphilus TaxID=1548597 RepID=UPI001375E909|nr:ECF transporter S component [Anaerobacillus alkaliphilus]